MLSYSKEFYIDDTTSIEMWAGTEDGRYFGAIEIYSPKGSLTVIEINDGTGIEDVKSQLEDVLAQWVGVLQHIPSEEWVLDNA